MTKYLSFKLLSRNDSYICSYAGANIPAFDILTTSWCEGTTASCKAVTVFLKRRENLIPGH